MSATSFKYSAIQLFADFPDFAKQAIKKLKNLRLIRANEDPIPGRRSVPFSDDIPEAVISCADSLHKAEDIISDFFCVFYVLK